MPIWRDCRKLSSEQLLSQGYPTTVGENEFNVRLVNLRKCNASRLHQEDSRSNVILCGKTTDPFR